MYAKDGAVKCCGYVSRDQERVHLSDTNDVMLNIVILSISKTLRITIPQIWSTLIEYIHVSTEKRILQYEIYLMNWQVIIVCDLKMKISFVQYMTSL